jgi:predicted Fe-Mo cluster-binding NifX family protein
MKIAIPVWNDLVSTVLDFSDRLLIADCEAGHVENRTVVDLAETAPVAKVSRLKELGIQVLLCGAVSRPLEQMIMAAGIEIIPFLKGRTDDVLNAYLSRRLSGPGFMLPGCRWGYGPGRGMGRGMGGGPRGRGRRRGWNI